jgi:hypothetical protein
MNLQDKYADILAEEMRKEIDAEIMFEMFKTNGWYPVEDCRNLSFNYTALKQVDEWLTVTCSGRYHVKGHSDYIFELHTDAVMFKLRWS